MNGPLPPGVQITAPPPADLALVFEEILSPQALDLVARLHRMYNPRRLRLLQARAVHLTSIQSGQLPDFSESTAGIREDPNWTVAPPPADLRQRWVEITGPTDRKMLINALNSGADVFMADFEDANSPTWENMVEGQFNLRDAIDGDIEYTSPEGKHYSLQPHPAVLFVRPRGWHLIEKHVLIDGEPVSASLFDFGLYIYHNAYRLLAKGARPYFYLPKLESHLEARLWNEVFTETENYLELPKGTIRATVLIETILAAFEMEEILFDLREHSAGLNAGRWDYIFSIIKKFHNLPGFQLPDRSQVTMTSPFMQAYTRLLVHTCHKRGAHAIGGMSAYIPNRRDVEVNDQALQQVRSDKLREVEGGFDGAWVAHPDLVSVVREIFEQALLGQPNQIMRLPEVNVRPSDLLDFQVPGGTITEAGLRQNIRVAILYLQTWLRGSGAVAISNLMEDTATAEISRAQVWSWLHPAPSVASQPAAGKMAPTDPPQTIPEIGQPLSAPEPGVCLADGRLLDLALYRRLFAEELQEIENSLGSQDSGSGLQAAAQLFDRLATAPEFIEFLTLAAYDQFP